jgi:hypothetical protein
MEPCVLKLFCLRSLFIVLICSRCFVGETLGEVDALLALRAGARYSDQHSRTGRGAVTGRGLLTAE